MSRYKSPGISEPYFVAPELSLQLRRHANGCTALHGDIELQLLFTSNSRTLDSSQAGLLTFGTLTKRLPGRLPCANLQWFCFDLPNHSCEDSPRFTRDSLFIPLFPSLKLLSGARK